MIEIRKNGTFLVDGVKYWLYKNLKGSLLAVNAATKDMFLVFNGLNENNVFIPLKKGIESLCPEEIQEVFPKKCDEVNHDNHKILLVNRERKKYLIVYVGKLYKEENESLYDVESITEVGNSDELIFFAPQQHKVIPLGVTKKFTVSGNCIT